MAAFALCFSDELPVAYLSYWPCSRKKSAHQELRQIFLRARAEVLARGFNSMHIWVLASQEELLRTLEKQDLGESFLFTSEEEIPAGTRSFFHGYWNYLQMNLVASEPSRVLAMRV